MAFLTVMPRRSRFDLNYDQYMELPVRLRDQMAEQLNRWRREEDRNAKKRR